MKIFLSSTFLDLSEDRQAVLEALRRRRASTLAMEDFLATPTTPAETALENLRNSDVMILVIGFKAGSLLSDGTGRTYTWAEYEELLRLGKEALVFVKKERGWFRKKAEWKNKERSPEKKKALRDFLDRVGKKYTYDTYETPDQLALHVIQSLDRWEAKGRPGARKTFASIEDYFAGKNPTGHFQLLDFGTTLLGRDKEFEALDEFLRDAGKRVAIVNGRGGIGKSKLLHDWARHHEAECLFLKDQPFWHEDSEKEIPVDCKVLIVDDAHRLESLGNVLQLFRDTAKHRSLKLLLSTRPGSSTRLAQSLYPHLDSAVIVQFPELKELTRDESRALAEQVLGTEFQTYAAHLAQIGSNSPLVIVAGGRLIATRRINPASLTTLDEFRAAIFHRLLDEMDLTGPRFAINPPRPVLELIAILGPVDVEGQNFQESARQLLQRPLDEILSTIDALAATGIVTLRPKPVRVIPDVLSDWLVEDRCIGPGGRTTHYADRVYDAFGAHSLKSLMRNLAELDWRKGQAGETGLNLLDSIWADLHTRFRSGDEYARHSILGELEPAAIYQPVHVLGLIRMAIDAPVVLEEGGEGSGYRLGQSYVVTALPGLLEGTAYHPEHIRESVGILWRLAKGEDDRNSTGSSARAVLKRLASWRRYTDAAFYFAMLLQAIRLMTRPDAFTDEYTPFDIIRQLLEKDGEFTEWQDETTMSFGGFGLNYTVVGPVRRSALDYLDFALAGDGFTAIQAIQIMEKLLHNYLNRMGRASSPEERTWQDAERARCIDSLLRRYQEPASDVLKARIFDALRSATAISCPDWVRERTCTALTGLDVPDAVVVVDAISTAEHELPFLSTEFSESRWESAVRDVLVKGRSSLERLIEGSENQARFTLEKTKACLAVRVATGGFHRFMLTFVDRLDFLEAMADHIICDEEIKRLPGQLASVLNAIHTSRPEIFRQRALAAIDAGASEIIHAAASNLRVFSGATEEDIALIQVYAGYADPVAKLGAIFAITYMGKFTHLLPALKEAILCVHTEGNDRVAAELADAFGPYGVPLTNLTRDEAAGLVKEFALVRDWDFDQGAIPRFLNRFVNLFPDEMFDVLTDRIERNSAARTANLPGLRTFGLSHGDVSFSSVPTEKRMELAATVLRQALMPGAGEEASDLFWDVAGIDDRAFDLILRDAPGISEDSLTQLVALLDKATPRLAFNKLQFVKDLLRSFHGAARQKVIDIIAYQSYRRGRGAFAGDPRERMAKEQQSFRDAVGALAEDPELDDLLLAMRHFL